MLVCTSLENDCRRFRTQRARSSRWRRRWPRWKGNGSMWVLHTSWRPFEQMYLMCGLLCIWLGKYVWIHIWCGGHIYLVWRERYVADDCSGKGFYCGHFLLQRSHTVLPLSLSASPLPHSAKISAPPIGQKILILNPPFISAPTKCAFWRSIFTPLKPFPTLSF